VADPTREPVGIAVVRVWREAGPPSTRKIRISTARDVEQGLESVAVTTEPEAVCAAILEWLRRFDDESDAPGGAAAASC
jgi:hypothetical protein